MEHKTYKIKNSGELNDYILVLVVVFVFFIIIHQIAVVVLLFPVCCFFYSIMRRDIYLGEDGITIKRIYAPYLKTLELDYAEIKKVSIIGGVYSTRMPTGMRINFKNNFRIEYSFDDKDEKEEILSLLIRKNVKINPNDFPGIKELIRKNKKT